MKRDGQGRFRKKQIIEINIPALSAIFKYSVLILLLSPWVYLLIKFDILAILESWMTLLFGNKCTEKKPY